MALAVLSTLFLFARKVEFDGSLPYAEVELNDLANDPRLTLPRYWPMQMLSQLDTIRVMGKDAAAYAEQNKATELEYYDIVCAPTLGPISGTP